MSKRIKRSPAAVSGILIGAPILGLTAGNLIAEYGRTPASVLLSLGGAATFAALKGVDVIKRRTHNPTPNDPAPTLLDARPARYAGFVALSMPAAALGGPVVELASQTVAPYGIGIGLAVGAYALATKNK